ncbi:MAG: 1,2-phenylacetyl-CoA epoxidase subunit PaaD [Bacteroidia bacterium]|nr:1,2-phenylacetyl-CoA epoxidase subunit PaaD [Bacteroidia bacterium]
MREWLRSVPDPEIPFVSIVDMGMIQGVEITGSQVKVTIVPTFAGCPAIRLLQEQIRQVIEEKGLTATVEVDYAQPWKAEYMTKAAWEGLRRAGFALPQKLSEDPWEMLHSARCPRCDSDSVSLLSPFGPTACRAIFKCHTCGEAFELFKPPV